MNIQLIRKLGANPCYKCKNRRPNCHAECDKYQKYVLIIKKANFEASRENIIGYSTWLKKIRR